MILKSRIWNSCTKNQKNYTKNFRIKNSLIKMIIYLMGRLIIMVKNVDSGLWETKTVLLFINCFTLISDGSFTLLFVTNMKYVLDQFRSSLLKKHQSNKGLILARKRFIKMFRSWSASYRVVSSANILHASSMMNAKSFIIRRKKNIKIY